MHELGQLPKWGDASGWAVAQGLGSDASAVTKAHEGLAQVTKVTDPAYQSWWRDFPNSHTPLKFPQSVKSLRPITFDGTLLSWWHITNDGHHLKFPHLRSISFDGALLSWWHIIDNGHYLKFPRSLKNMKNAEKIGEPGSGGAMFINSVQQELFPKYPRRAGGEKFLHLIFFDGKMKKNQSF